MAHIVYGHQINPSIGQTVAKWLHARLFGRLSSMAGPAEPSQGRRRLWTCLSWLVVLFVQAALILVVKEVIELCHGVIGLYLDLAKIQLDLTSQYVTATSP